MASWQISLDLNHSLKVFAHLWASKVIFASHKFVFLLPVIDTRLTTRFWSNFWRAQLWPLSLSFVLFIFILRQTRLSIKSYNVKVDGVLRIRTQGLRVDWVFAYFLYDTKLWSISSRLKFFQSLQILKTFLLWNFLFMKMSQI